MQKVVFGLGNPGKTYEKTRHNFGFVVLDELVRRWHIEFEPGWGDFMIAKYENATLVKPMTFMNRSGMAVSQFHDKHKKTNNEMIVVYDDLDLPLGQLRFRARGSSAGHRGIESISRTFGTDEFHRLRLGIDGEFRHPTTEKYVVELFRKEEEPLVEKMTEVAANGVEFYLQTDVFAAMNQFNKLKFI